MSDNKKNNVPEEEEKDYIPSSPVKRTLAWIALVYVLIFLGLTTYFYFTGTMLGNLAPLLTVPGLIGLGVVSLVSWKTNNAPKKGQAILIAIVCWLLAIATIPLGMAGLMSNFGLTDMVGVSFLIH